VCAAVSAQDPGVMGMLGWRRVAGVVVGVEPLYQAKRRGNLAVMSLMVVVGLLLLPVALGLALAMFLIGVLTSRVGLRSPFLSSLFSQITGYWFTRKLLGPGEQVTIRDVRLLSGQSEHFLRFEGDLVAGSVAVGDDIEVEGFNRGGTLMVRKGVNRRTRATIRLRR
jgi:hypothetical protein